MEEKIEEYLSRVGLVIDIGEIDKEFLKNLENIPPSRDAKLSYVVPELTPDGTCSSGDGLADEPYDLRNIAAFNNLKLEDISALVARLDSAVDFFHQALGADWTGIYRKLNTSTGSALVKLAYRGRPSRAEFPLTEDFVAHSNNSTVGLSGKAVVVQNVEQYIQDGGSYYECDANVRWEICLPVFSPTGQVVGIVDSESFQPSFFSPKKIAQAAIVCVYLGDILESETQDDKGLPLNKNRA